MLINAQRVGRTDEYILTADGGKELGTFTHTPVPESTDKDRQHTIILFGLKQTAKPFITGREENEVSRLIAECESNEYQCEISLTQVSAGKKKLMGLKTILESVQIIENTAKKHIEEACKAHSTFIELQTTSPKQRSVEAETFKDYQKQVRVFKQTIQETKDKIKEKKEQIKASVINPTTRAANAEAQNKRLIQLSLAIRDATEGKIAELMDKLDTEALKDNIAAVSHLSSTAEAASEQEEHSEIPRFDARAVDESAARPNKRLEVIARQLSTFSPEKAITELVEIDDAIAAL